MASHTAANCLNCNATLPTGAKFCAQCGQAAHLHRFNLSYFIHEAIHYFIHADKSIFFLVKELALNPGLVAANYLKGMRKRYFPPFTFFLICAGLLLLSTKMFNPASGAELLALKARMSETSLSPQQLYGMGFQYRALQVRQFFATYSNFVNMGAAPLMVFFLWLFYLRRKYNYYEHLVANLFFIGFTSLGYALIFLPLVALLRLYNATNAGLLAYFVFEMGYRAFCYYQWMRQDKPGGLFKAIAVSILVSGIWFVLSYAAIWFYIRYGG